MNATPMISRLSSKRANEHRVPNVYHQHISTTPQAMVASWYPSKWSLIQLVGIIWFQWINCSVAIGIRARGQPLDKGNHGNPLPLGRSLGARSGWSLTKILRTVHLWCKLGLLPFFEAGSSQLGDYLQVALEPRHLQFESTYIRTDRYKDRSI